MNPYRQTEVNTADPVRLIVLCCEEAVRNLRLAGEHLQRKEYEAKGNNISKFIEILHLLMQSLDFKKGGEVARNLDRLYNYMLRRIQNGDLHHEAEAFEEVAGMMEELLAGWKGLAADGTAPATRSMNGYDGGRDGKAALKPSVMGAY